MSAYGQPFQTYGFKTSIDIARGQSFNGHANSSSSSNTSGVTQLAGRKRSLESSPTKPSTAEYPQPRGFVPSSPIPKNHLVAGQIRQTSSDAKSGSSGADTGFEGGHLTPQSFLQENPENLSDNNHNGRLPLTLDSPCYGLPATLVANFTSLGVKSIYPWQASCLLGRGLLTGERNLVYTAPTGGGKSLVADVLMLKRIIENPSRKAILILPYVALVQEKLKWLRRIVEDVDTMVTADESSNSTNPYHQRWSSSCKIIRVSGYFSGSRTAASWADTNIAVCTIEKVSSTTVLA